MLPSYEVLRSANADDFVTAAICLPSPDTRSTSLTDANDPGAGGLFHYLVRAVNQCPEGVGTLGFDSDEDERTGVSCP